MAKEKTPKEPEKKKDPNQTSSMGTCQTTTRDYK